MTASSPLAGLLFRVADLEAQREFYEQVLGLQAREQAEARVRLAPADETFAVELHHDPEARPRPRSSIGLFHVAYRLPDRRSLAEAIVHLRGSGVSIQGLADHGVSEAVYLSDAEGNGIELYRDRPREEWPRQDDMVAMVTDPLDLGGLLADVREPQPPPEGTTIGHIHLHVPELAAAERFFVDGLGLRVRQRDFPGALFMARDEYHHHVGANTWASQQAPDDAVGLEAYTWRGEVAEARSRFAKLGLEPAEDERGLALDDPAGLRLRVVEETA